MARSAAGLSPNGRGEAPPDAINKTNNQLQITNNQHFTRIGQPAPESVGPDLPEWDWADAL